MFSSIRMLVFLLVLPTLVFAESRNMPQLLEEARTHLEQAKILAGSRDEMTDRAVVLLHLYHQSSQNLPFALTISHLTLAIENSTYSPKLIKQLEYFHMKSLAQEWKEWGEELRSINRRMVELFAFSYLWTEYRVKQGLPLPGSTELASLLSHLKLQDEGMPIILKVMMEVHLANLRQEVLSEEMRRDHFERLVLWEHKFVIQNRMEAKAKDLNLLWKISLRNVPGRVAEALIMKPVFDVTTTLSLQCFPVKRHLRTKNFLSLNDRIEQAREFFLIFETLNFDPDMSCYHDPSYRKQLGRDFLQHPKYFSELLYRNKLKTISPTGKWLIDQWEKIPVKERPALPHLTIPIHKRDLINLDLTKNPITRNSYISESYRDIAYKLAHCTETFDQANWYHYAYWASKSAGEVISGNKFNSYDIISRSLYGAASRLRVIPTEKEMAAMFARTNTLIAIEMIPIGRHFISEFCQNKSNLKAFNIFSKHFSQSDEKEIELEKAFKNYFHAILEKDLSQKRQLISLGATLQVLSEQKRVHENIDTVFKLGSDLKDPVEHFYRWYASHSGALKMCLGEVVPLTKNVSTIHLAPELKSISVEDYIKLHQKHKVELAPSGRYFQKTAVKDWGDLSQRLRFLVAMFRAHAVRPEVTILE